MLPLSVTEKLEPTTGLAVLGVAVAIGPAVVLVKVSDTPPIVSVVLVDVLATAALVCWTQMLSPLFTVPAELTKVAVQPIE